MSGSVAVGDPSLSISTSRSSRSARRVGEPQVPEAVLGDRDDIRPTDREA